MAIGDLGSIRFVSGAPDLRRLLGLPDLPIIATAASIAAKLRGLAEVEGNDAVAGTRLTMLALGLFVFGLDTLAYQELQRRTDWRHGATDRLGARAALQFLGAGEDVITLPGTLMPGVAGDSASLDRLRTMGDSGQAWPLVASTGTVVGQYVIVAIDDRRTAFLPGGAARQIDFAIDLKRAD